MGLCYERDCDNLDWEAFNITGQRAKANICKASSGVSNSPLNMRKEQTRMQEDTLPSCMNLLFYAYG